MWFDDKKIVLMAMMKELQTEWKTVLSVLALAALIATGVWMLFQIPRQEKIQTTELKLDAYELALVKSDWERVAVLRKAWPGDDNNFYQALANALVFTFLHDQCETLFMLERRFEQSNGLEARIMAQMNSMSDGPLSEQCAIHRSVTATITAIDPN